MVSPSKRDKGWRQAKIGSWRKERTSCGTASNVRYLTLMADCRGRANQPGFEPDKNTFHPLADVSFQWVAKSSSSSSMIAKKSVIHSTWSHWPSIWLKEWRFTSNGERLKWSKSEVILWNLSSSANLRFSRRKSISWCVFLNSFTGEETKCRAGVKHRSLWDRKCFQKSELQQCNITLC